VVISIIGMLSSITLVAIRSARGKGKIAASLTFETNIYHAQGDTAFGIWEFDDNVNNSSYNNFTSTAVGSPTYEDGVTRRAIKFNGSSQYVDVTFPSGYPDFGTNIAVTAWVKSSIMSTGNMFIVSRGEANKRWEIFFSGNVMFWRTDTATPGGTGQLTCPAPSSDEWHNIAASQSGGSVKLYIDGKLCNSSTFDRFVTNNIGIIRIGALSSNDAGAGPGYYFNGSIDTVRLYSQALSASEIGAIYASEAPSYKFALKE
ncbi:MAG: LamG domain-containing protein, partial [Candidatus Paceibacterota bacterium]